MLINKVVYRTERERVKQLNEMNGKYIELTKQHSSLRIAQDERKI